MREKGAAGQAVGLEPEVTDEGYREQYQQKGIGAQKLESDVHP